MPGGSSHRIFKYCVVPPCEDVNPAALIDNMMELCRRITNYDTLRRCYRDPRASVLIREIRILLLFLEELQNYGTEWYTPTMVLCFSEMHACLQKMSCLLGDLCRVGTKVWFFMHGDLLAEEIRLLLRDLGTALDVLPVEQMFVCHDMKEHLGLMKKQIRRVRFRSKPVDESEVKEILDVMHELHRKIMPDSSRLCRILDHLEIYAWTECDAEIQFLEGKIVSEELSGNEREIELINKLIAVMLYCRCALFEPPLINGWSPDNISHGLNTGTNGNIFNTLGLDDFKCPISLELMKDPVTLKTGHTYERSSILNWFKGGHLTCPKTGEKLSSAYLIPNTALLNLIQQSCSPQNTHVVNASPNLQQSWKPGAKPGKENNSLPVTEEMAMVFAVLVDKLMWGANVERGNAAYEIRLLTKTNTSNRAHLSTGRAVTGLLNLLRHDDPITQDNAIYALLNLSKNSCGRRKIVMECGLEPVAHVLNSGHRMEARQAAAATLFYLTSITEFRKLIGDKPDVIPALVDLIKMGKTKGKKSAVLAIYGLLLFPGNHPKILNSGIVPHLIDTLKANRTELISEYLAVVAVLSERPEGSYVMIRMSILPILIALLQSCCCPAAKEYCVATLYYLCVHGGNEVVSILQGVRELMGPLYTLLTDGTSPASNKASSLLKILHNCHNLRSEQQYQHGRRDGAVRVP